MSGHADSHRDGHHRMNSDARVLGSLNEALGRVEADILSEMRLPAGARRHVLMDGPAGSNVGVRMRARAESQEADEDEHRRRRELALLTVEQARRMHLRQ